jgi:hypothetical protein
VVFALAETSLQNNFLPFIQADGWRLKDCGLEKYNLRSGGDIRGRSNIPESSFNSSALLDR